MRRSSVLLLSLLLTACAGEPVRWARPGGSADQASSDFASCRAQARASVNQALGSEADRLNMITAPPTLLGQSAGMLESLQRDQLAAEGRKRQDAETTACMRAKGYVPR